jgi:hypothetical protein
MKRRALTQSRLRKLLPLLLLSACATPKTPATVATQPGGGFGSDQQVPDYAKRPYEPFSRLNAIAIAQREWRGFGSIVDDSGPGPDMPKILRPDQQPGLWQRVGDYWWSGQDFGAKEAGWTSVYNANGTPYAGTPPAWSAAFISYVMRAAGAGTGFVYSPLHADYINAAARGEGVVRAERLDNYAPVPGDLVCFGRQSARSLRFEDLPAPRFFGHCDIVVSATPGQLTVIGGNVAAAVTMKHIPTTPDGKMAGPDGRPLDDRFPWFVALNVRYDQ